jgi:predicted AAA+ superfamily ATPase
VDILEQTFLVRRLTPFHRNVRKRLVKTPKVYLRDTGLLHHLLNLGTASEVASHPVAGVSFERFVLEDLLRRERLVRPHTQAYFWRAGSLVIDQSDTIDTVAPGIERRGVARALTWLPLVALEAVRGR